MEVEVAALIELYPAVKRAEEECDDHEGDGGRADRAKLERDEFGRIFL